MKHTFRRRKTSDSLLVPHSSSTLVEEEEYDDDDDNDNDNDSDNHNNHSETSPLTTMTTTAQDVRSSSNVRMRMSMIPPFVLRATAIASLGGILFGYDMGVISVALPQITVAFDLAQTQQQVVVGVLYLGGGIGASVGGLICDATGRKTTILLTDVVFLLGATIMALASTHHVYHLVLGRIVMGMGIAISGIADVAFLNEMAPKQWRGSIVSVNEACISLGFLIAYLVGNALSFTSNGWRSMFGLSGVLAMIQFVGMMSMPESPLWLREKDRIQESHEALKTIYGGEQDIPTEEESQDDAASSVLSSSRHCFVTHDSLPSIHKDDGDDVGLPSTRSHLCESTIRAWRSLACTLCRYNKQVWIALFLAVAQQLSGQTNVLNYAPLIFGQFNQAIALSSTLWIGVVKFLTTVVVIFRIESMGRRNLLLAGMSVIVLGLLLLTLAFVIGTAVTNDDGELVPSNQVGMYLALSGVLCVVIGYSASFGPLTWLLTSELFPTDIRGRALGATTIVTYLCAFLTTSTFLTASTWLGGFAFLVYAFFTFAGLVFTHLAIPDTADKTVHEVDEELSKMWWWTKRDCSMKSAVEHENTSKSNAPIILDSEMT